VAPQSSGSWQLNYSTKPRQTGRTNAQFMYSLMTIGKRLDQCDFGGTEIQGFCNVVIFLTPQVAWLLWVKIQAEFELNDTMH
jgi:hypothetical protein